MYNNYMLYNNSKMSIQVFLVLFGDLLNCMWLLLVVRLLDTIVKYCIKFSYLCRENKKTELQVIHKTHIT